MGLLSRLLGGDGGEKPRSIRGVKAEYPSVEHTSTVSLIESLVRLVDESGSENLWVSFSADAGQGRDDIGIQVGRRQLNTLLESVDMGAVCSAAGLERLVGAFEAVDEGLYEMRAWDVGDMARAVDAVYVHHFGLRAGYPLRGVIEG